MILRTFLSNLLEKTSNHNTSLVTHQLINYWKLPITRTTAIDSLEAHPDFPSLYSISDNLKKWKIDSLALQIDAEKLDELPVPFIAHLKKGAGSFLVVTKVTGTDITYLADSGQEKQKSRDAFVEEWGKIILVAEASKQSGEKDFLKERKKERINNARLPLILLASLAFVTGYVFVNINSPGLIWSCLLLVTNLAGTLVASLLLWFEIDKSNPVLKQVCGTSNAGSKTNCTAVLESKQAKILGIGWSEIGFFYFAGSFLFLLLSNQSFAPLAWLNILALPYVVFSIFYQWQVAKQWCPLCLAVQALLLIQLSIGIAGYWQFAGFTLPANIVSGNLLMTAFICFSVPVIFWVFTKNILMKNQRAESLRKEVNKFKYNPELFESLLSTQKAIPSSPDTLGITLGNPEAETTIIKVCSPFCGPCAIAHPVLENLLEGNANVKVKIIFSVPKDKTSTASKVVGHLMALYEKNNSELIKHALDDWYNAEKKDYDAFAAKYQLNGELQKQGEKLEMMEKWCEETVIHFTPTIFVNGHQLPEVYKLDDLKHLL